MLLKRTQPAIAHGETEDQAREDNDDSQGIRPTKRQTSTLIVPSRFTLFVGTCADISAFSENIKSPGAKSRVANSP
jgi:hypothetical protein